MGIGQALTMPLFFASNAVYPISIMPGWLKAFAQINPLTYEVDAMRALMVAGGRSLYGIGLDLAVLVATTVALWGWRRDCTRILPASELARYPVRRFAKEVDRTRSVVYAQRRLTASG